MEGKCTFYTKIVNRGDLLIDKFTVYCFSFGHPTNFTFIEMIYENFFCCNLMLNGISVSFLHQDFEDNIHRKNQNIEIASNHLMGDK